MVHRFVSLRSRWLLVWIALIAACGSTQRTQRDGVMADAFTYAEKSPQSSGYAPLDRRLIDYESTVLVEPDAEKLRKVLGARGPAVQSESVESKQAGIEFLTQTLTPSLEGLVDLQRRSQKALEAPVRANEALSDDADWRAIAQEQLATVKMLETLVHLEVSSELFEGRWDPKVDLADAPLSEVEMESAVDRINSIYARLSPQANEFAVPAITELTNELHARLLERLGELERALDENTPQVGMEATLVRGDQRLPISIEPYSRVEGVGRGAKSKRVGIPNKQDMERVRKAYDEYAKLAKSIEELRKIANDKRALAAARAKLVEQIRARLKSACASIRSELDKLASEPAFASVQAAVAKLIADTTRIADAVERLGNGAQANDGKAVATAASDLIELIGTLDVVGDLDRLVKALEQLENALPAAAKQLSKSAREILGNEWKKLLDDLANDPATAPIGGLIAAMKQLKVYAELPGFGGLEPSKPILRRFELADAPVGVVQLDATPAESGDVLELRQTLHIGPPPANGSNAEGLTDAVANAGAAGAAPADVREFSSTRNLEVRKYGLYTTFNAQLVFYDRLHDGSTSFAAAPGVYYNFHYRPERWTNFFDTVAPGLGFHVSTPSFEDGTEIAVGVQATFLNDVLQIGYARNLSVDDEPEMFFLGFDLIEAYRAMN